MSLNHLFLPPSPAPLLRQADVASPREPLTPDLRFAPPTPEPPDEGSTLGRWAKRFWNAIVRAIDPEAHCPGCGAPAGRFAEAHATGEQRFIASVQYRCNLCDTAWHHCTGHSIWDL